MNLVHGSLQCVKRIILDTRRDAGRVLRGFLQRNSLAVVEGDLIGGVNIDLVSIRLAPVDLKIPHRGGGSGTGFHIPAGCVRRGIALCLQGSDRIVAGEAARQVLLLGIDFAAHEDFQHLLVHSGACGEDGLSVEYLVRAKSDVTEHRIGDQGACSCGDIRITGFHHTSHTPGNTVDQIDLRPGCSRIIWDHLGV